MRTAFAAAAAAVTLCAVAGIAAPARADDSCPAPSEWFPHQNTPMPDFAAFPADPNNCIFHQYSWQTFLWLTQAMEDGTLRFESFASPDALLPEGTPGMPGTGLNPFIGRTSKSSVLSEHVQAGPAGILVDQNGRIVYYSQYLDTTFSDFVAANHLSDPKILRAFDGATSFPVGTIELKASWKIVGPNDKTDGFYTREATVALLKNGDGGIVIDPDRTQDVTVALVGLHIGFVVENHPEMIWASFEHNDNAPDIIELGTMKKGVDPLAGVKPDDIVSDTDWTFYRANTPVKGCNINAAGARILTLDAATQTLSPVTQACRLYPYGSSSDKIDNANNIVSVNSSAQSQLNGAGDVFANYFEVGAIWFDTTDGKALQPDCSFQPPSATPTLPQQCGVIVTGSTHLSNATIETFTQSQSTQDNCFACHNTLQAFSSDPDVPSLPGKNVSISHIILNNYLHSSKAE